VLCLLSAVAGGACGLGPEPVLTAEADGCHLEVRAEPRPGTEVAHGTTIRIAASSPDCELGLTAFLSAAGDSDSAEGGPVRLEFTADASQGLIEGVVVARFVQGAAVASVPLSWSVRETRRPARLKVEPDQIESDAPMRAESVQVIVHYADGSSVPARDLTLRVADDRVARVVDGNWVQGWSNGHTTVRIAAAGLHAEIPVRVRNPIEIGAIDGASPCAGPGLTVSNLRAGEVVELFTGSDDGSTVEMPGCPQTALDLGALRSVGVVTADASGEVTFCAPFDEAVQALVRDAGRTTCAQSRLVSRVDYGW